MNAFYKIAAATVLCVASGARAGDLSAPANFDLPPIHASANAAADGNAVFVASLDRLDRPEGILAAPVVSQAYFANDHAQLPPNRADDVTVVPLPPAAPAGFLTLGLIGLFGFIRKMRNRIAVTG